VISSLEDVLSLCLSLKVNKRAFQELVEANMLKDSDVVPGSERRSPTSREFERLVGKDVYATWKAMLKKLVPGGRTHRLSVVVAGMLYYASMQKTKDAGNAARRRFDEAEGADFEETEALLLPLVEQLLQDAGVEWKKKNSKGQSYSIAEESVREFFNWDLMPWE
jgi:hypothetical protein